MDEFIKLAMEILGTDNIELRAPNELEKTVPDMLSDDYKKRFKAEYKQLLIRYQRLCMYLRKIDAGTAKHTCPVTLLKQQHKLMGDYLNILVERAYYEGVNLND